MGPEQYLRLVIKRVQFFEDFDADRITIAKKSIVKNFMKLHQSG
jgi:hypothetical protein